MADLPMISISDAFVNEADGQAVFEVRLSAPSAQTVTVRFDDHTGSAGSSDFDGFDLFDSRTLSFAPGETIKTVAVGITDDTTAEGPESFQIALENPTNGVIGRSNGIGTILDNDGPKVASPAISVAGGSFNESDGTATFVVRLAGPSNQTVSVDWATQNGTARAGSDYVADSGSLSFAPGETVKTVQVALLDDHRDEPLETLRLRLSGAEGGTIGTSSATASLLDNGAPTRIATDGFEIFSGSPGFRAISYARSDAGVIVDLTTGTGDRGFAENDELYAIEDLVGSRFSDRLTGNAFINVLNGGQGNDILRGLDGDDELAGSVGNDNLVGGNGDDAISGGDDNDRLSGDAGNDRLGGGAGNDVLRGGSGDDVLDGGAGNDILIGGIGSDLLRGSTGADSFLFSNLSEAGDTILDFDAANDTIDLSRMLVGFPGTLAFVSRYVRLIESGNSSILQVNRDGTDDDFVDIALIRGLTGVNARQLFADDALILA